MALGKTLQYTPFQEVSFAYSSTEPELATNYETEFPNADTIVRVVIKHSTGNWGVTGHISTPSSGTAISIYNKKTNTWTCKGERSDVDAVLSQLKFYPADYGPSRPKDDENENGFEVLAFKANQTTGNYTDEEPPAIGDTVFTIKAYAGTNTNPDVSESLTFDPVEPNYGNQRPYWSALPTTADYGSSDYDSDEGQTIDFGTISHGTDTETVTVTGHFAQWKSDQPTIEDGVVTDSYITDDRYGNFVGIEDMYIGDIIADSSSEQSSSEKFSITGTVAECQAFLDNIRFKTNTSIQKSTFDIHLKIFDGVVGSVIKKTMWHPQTLIIGPLIHQSFKEDATARFDLGDFIYNNKDDIIEVTSYKAVLTLDSTGISGTSSFGTNSTVDTETYSNGVLTLIDSEFENLKGALRNLEFVPLQDFATDFTFTVDFIFENTDVGSSYTNSTTTINVTAQEVAEAYNVTQTHNWKEDQVYYFKFNNPIQIIHAYNEEFDVEFNIGSIDFVGDLHTFSQTNHTRTLSDGIITYSGTRDVLNDVLYHLTFIPVSDFDQSFTMPVKITRTTGTNLANADITTGTLTMVATPQEEYSYEQTEKYNWDEDVPLNFETGITILDTSLDDPLLPSYGANFKFSMRAKYADGTAISNNDLSWTCFYNNENIDISGSGTVADPLIITGGRVDLNIAMNALRMTPAADFTATQDFYVELRLERGETTDTFYAEYLNFNEKVNFDKGKPSDEFEAPVSIAFGLERISTIDGYRIVDVAKDKQYELNFTIDNDGEGFLRAVSFGSASATWNKTDKRLYITGNKNDVNQVLQTIEYVPTFNFSTDFQIYYYQRQVTDNITQANGSDSISMVFDSTLEKYQVDESTDLFYEEDLLNQKDCLIYTTLENLDGAEDITEDPVNYRVKLRLNPTTEIHFTGDYAEPGVLESDVVEARGSEITFTGSRKYCNNLIKNVSFDAIADQINDVDIHYTQERYVNYIFDETQASDVVGASLRVLRDVGEVTFSPWKQYFTTENASSGNGEEITQRYLQEYEKDKDGNIKNEYTRPITIQDHGAEAGGVTLYKLDITSSNLPAGMSISGIEYKTKEQFHEFVSNGIPLVAEQNLEDTLYNGQNFEINMKVTRKLPSGTETVLEENSLTYEYAPRPRLLKLPDTFQWGSEGVPIRHSSYKASETDTINYKSIVTYEMANGDATDLTKLDEVSDYYLFVTRGRHFWSSDLHDTMRSLDDYEDKTIFENVTGGNLTYSLDTYIKGIYNYKVFQIKASRLEDAQTVKHTFVNRFGLKLEATINYKESSVKYSEHMSHRQRLEVSTFTQGEMFGHDTGSVDATRDGSWTIPSTNALQRNSPSTENLTLCSHFWVSPTKYAFKYINSAIDVLHLADNDNVTRAFDSMWSYTSGSGRVRTKVDTSQGGDLPYLKEDLDRIDSKSTVSRFLTPPLFDRKQVVGYANKVDSLKADLTEINGLNYVFATKALTNRTSWYQQQGYTPPGGTIQYQQVKYGPFTSFSDSTSSIRFGRNLGQLSFAKWGGDFARLSNTQNGYDLLTLYPPKFNVLGTPIGRLEYGFRGMYDNIPQALFFNEQSPKIASALIFTTSGNQKFYKSDGIPFEYTPVLAASNYYELDNSDTNPAPDQNIRKSEAANWAQDFKWPNWFINGTSEYKYQWFDVYPDYKNSSIARPEDYNYIQTSNHRETYNYSRILADTTWDCMVGSWVEAPSPKHRTNERFSAQQRISIPNIVVMTRSFTHNAWNQETLDFDGLKLYNQAIVLKWSGEMTELGPIWNVVGNFKEKINNTDEKYRWARRNFRDNTNRILHDVSSSGDDFYLPSGHKIESNSLVENGHASISKVVSEPVDKWLKLSNYGKCYIDVSKGVLQSIDVDRSVKFDNTLGTDKKYNYIYVTRDSASKDNLLYAMMAYVDTENTLTGNASSLLSRLMYINLEEE